MSTCNGSSPGPGHHHPGAGRGQHHPFRDRQALPAIPVHGWRQPATDRFLRDDRAADAGPGQFYLDRAMGVASGDPAKRQFSAISIAWLGRQWWDGVWVKLGPLLDGDWACSSPANPASTPTWCDAAKGEWVATSAGGKCPHHPPAGCQVPLRDRVGTIPGHQPRGHQ